MSWVDRELSHRKGLLNKRQMTVCGVIRARNVGAERLGTRYLVWGGLLNTE
jgi:hypothetical protein